MGRTLRIDGVDLSIIEKGSGPPLLLLHGSGSVTEDFAVSGVLDLASAKHRVLAFDRPGFGGSTRPARKRWSACEQADLFHEAAANLGVHKDLVLGHSWGAWIALEMARRHAPSVAGLVTAATRSRQLHADHHRSGQPGEGQSACAQPVRRRRHCPPAGSLQ
ncbi:alpha/beta hydrolase [Mesorhizobium australicum]|uniref:alpha/beta fold hydrolase n=1 Tax=Mesorhizobium australicum TaxID=536018 RepID=UPI00333BBE65